MRAAATARGSSVREALEAAAGALAATGIETPRLDAEVLLAAAVGADRAALAADPDARLAPAASRAFAGFVRRRLRREPVAYILGAKGFRRLDIAVDRRVLIPRPETELLVEVALELGPKTLLDIGTGSGAVALSVADELPACAVTATDASEDALAVARENAVGLGLAERVRFEAGTVADGDFDLVVANLPYVSDAEWAALQPEVRDWEPREALLAGPDGLAAFRAVIPRLRSRAVALEVGAGQAPAVTSILEKHGFADAEARRDLAGIDRVVLARRMPSG